MHIRLISKNRVSFAQETDPEITAAQSQLITAFLFALISVLPAYQDLMAAKGKETTI